MGPELPPPTQDVTSCPESGHELELPSPGGLSEVSKTQVDQMIADIRDDDLRVLLEGCHDPNVRAKITEAYWIHENYEKRQ